MERVVRDLVMRGRPSACFVSLPRLSSLTRDSTQTLRIIPSLKQLSTLHFAALWVTVIIACLSAYCLSACNQVDERRMLHPRPFVTRTEGEGERERVGETRFRLRFRFRDEVHATREQRSCALHASAACAVARRCPWN